MKFYWNKNHKNHKILRNFEKYHGNGNENRNENIRMYSIKAFRNSLNKIKQGG